MTRVLRMARDLGSTSYWLALVAVHFFFAGYFVSVVAVPQSLEGQPDWLVGLVVGALGIAGMVTRPLVGVWVDSGNRQRWLRLGGIGTVIALAGYAISLDPWIMIGFRMLHGISMGLFTTALLATVSSLIPAERRGTGLGFYQSSNAVSQMYASPLAVALAVAISFEFAFAVGAAFAVVALLVGALVRDPEGEAAIAARPAGTKREWISRTALPPSSVFLMMTTTVGAVQAFLPLFALERDLGNVGLFYTVYSIALLGSRLTSGVLLDRFGAVRLAVPALVLGSLSLFVIASAQSQAVLLSIAVVYGLSFGAMQITGVSLAIERTPLSARGAAMATYTMAWDVGAVVGGILLGFVIDATSYAFGFALCGLLPLAGIAMLLGWVRPSRAPAAEVVGEAAG